MKDDFMRDWWFGWGNVLGYFDGG